MPTESITRIPGGNFVDALVRAVPRVAETVADHLAEYDELLLHLLLPDLVRLATDLYQRGEASELQRLLNFVDLGFSEGDPYVQNAIAVSFVEHVGAYPAETEDFIATWPASLLAERERQRSWVPPA